MLLPGLHFNLYVMSDIISFHFNQKGKLTAQIQKSKLNIKNI